MRLNKLSGENMDDSNNNNNNKKKKKKKKKYKNLSENT
jgi:hypothetical protein